MAVEEDCAVLLKKLIGIVDEIAEISDFKCVVRRQCRDLSRRRLKLLTPLFEEFLEIREKITEETVKALVLLEETLESAKEFSPGL
ncbi:hypothetical protein Acr_22g0003980 [Actinidia rufa]|uniref:Uncharacterized protein n=1 Tax=Actinidia rufa TaxID=165716 RepID=A0A7J0GJL5_9ERIC|nr:hypothetical protein Acr_22g0003980 [Actinidia rufa]